MRVINLANIKGGIGKSITAINMSYCLHMRGKRVLLIDNDKQGNSSDFFKMYDEDIPSISEVLLQKMSIKEVVRTTDCGLDIVPANLNLHEVNKMLLLETSKPREYIMRDALEEIEDEYDYVIVDNAPDINLSIINTLVAADDVVIPVCADHFSLKGIQILMPQLQNIRKYNNPKIRVAGILLTQYRNNDVNNQCIEFLKQSNFHVFDSKIRWTDKVSESTFPGKPVCEYSPRCGAAKDYNAFVNELLGEV